MPQPYMRLVEMHHLDQLVLDVRGFRCAVVVSRQSRRADQHVADADFAAAVALSVISGKTLHERAAELVFAAHEYVFPRNEYIVEHHQRFVATEFLVAHVNRPAFQFSRVTRLAAIDIEYPSASAGIAEETGIIVIFRSSWRSSA